MLIFGIRLLQRNRLSHISATKAGIDLSKVFDQYLRTTKIPLLKYNVNGKSVSFYYERVVKGFAMPIRVSHQWQGNSDNTERSKADL